VRWSRWLARFDDSGVTVVFNGVIRAREDVVGLREVVQLGKARVVPEVLTRAVSCFHCRNDRLVALLVVDKLVELLPARPVVLRVEVHVQNAPLLLLHLLSADHWSMRLPNNVHVVWVWWDRRVNDGNGLLSVLLGGNPSALWCPDNHLTVTAKSNVLHRVPLRSIHLDLRKLIAKQGSVLRLLRMVSSLRLFFNVQIVPGGNRSGRLQGVVQLAVRVEHVEWLFETFLKFVLTLCPVEHDRNLRVGVILIQVKTLLEVVKVDRSLGHHWFLHDFCPLRLVMLGGAAHNALLGSIVTIGLTHKNSFVVNFGDVAVFGNNLTLLSSFFQISCPSCKQAALGHVACKRHTPSRVHVSSLDFSDLLQAHWCSSVYSHTVEFPSCNCLTGVCAHLRFALVAAVSTERRRWF